MLINSIVICIALIVDTYIMYKLFQLSNMDKKKGSVIDFKERFCKRYVYYIPILKIDDQEIEWESNKKLNKNLLNKEITVLIKDKYEIYEYSSIFKYQIMLLVANALLVFGIYNIYLILK